MYMYVYMSICVCICVYIHICIYMHAHTHTSIYKGGFYRKRLSSKQNPNLNWKLLSLHIDVTLSF